MKNSALWLAVMMGAFMGTGAQAADYKPGSLGYVYEDCRRALAESANVQEIYASYCGAFIEGYFTGAMIANAAALPQPNAQDPCYEDKKREYERINARLCQNLPKYDPKKISAERIVNDAVDLVSRWMDYIRMTNPKSDPLAQPAAGAMGSLLAPGRFCDSLAQSSATQNTEVYINPALGKLSWNDYMGIQNQVTLMKKYEQCKRDFDGSGLDRKKFRASRCGAEIMGFIAGINSTAHLRPPEKTENPACGKEIARLYRSVNSAQSMCAPPETDALLVAHVFLERVETMPPREFNKDPGFANLKHVGAIGAETIYRGFLCARKSQP